MMGSAAQITWGLNGRFNEEVGCVQMLKPRAQATHSMTSHEILDWILLTTRSGLRPATRSPISAQYIQSQTRFTLTMVSSKFWTKFHGPSSAFGDRKQVRLGPIGKKTFSRTAKRRCNR